MGDESEGVDELGVVRTIPEAEVPYLVPSGRGPWQATMTPTLKKQLGAHEFLKFFRII
jgi:hypothetical protein